MKFLLKFIPVSEIIKIAWSILDPLIQKKIDDSKSPIDDKVYAELRLIILKIVSGV